MRTQGFAAAALTLLCLAVPGSSWAQGMEQSSPGGPHGGPEADRQHEHFEKKAHLLALLELAEALELSDAEALKLRATLAKFSDRRKPLHKEMKAQAEVLRRAAGGDATAYGQVDGAVQKMVALRTQIEQVDQDLFKALGQGLPPQKRARLALTLARLPHQLHEAMREGGPGGGMGPGGGRRPGGKGPDGEE